VRSLLLCLVSYGTTFAWRSRFVGINASCVGIGGLNVHEWITVSFLFLKFEPLLCSFSVLRSQWPKKTEGEHGGGGAPRLNSFVVWLRLSEFLLAPTCLLNVKVYPW
jgi:hypothetical protein